MMAIIKSDNKSVCSTFVFIYLRIALLFVYFATINEAAKLPSSFKQCHQSAADFDECLRVNIEVAIHSMRNATPEINMDSLEPLHIAELTIGQGKGAVNVVQHFKNIHLYGLTDSKVLRQRSNLAENQLFSESVTPLLRLNAEYNMNGRVLLLPVYGDGPCNITLVNTRINHTLVGVRRVRNGRSHLIIDKYTVTLRPERMTFKFDNLFGGDERLGAQINKILNDNWSEVFTDVRDGYERNFGAIFQSLANHVFRRLAFSDIFLD